MINTILNTAIALDGISYNILTGETNPDTGYMVSLADREKRVDELTAKAISNYISDNMRHLTLGRTFFGVWKDGEWVLDVSVNIPDLESAISAGLLNQQLAIWDCANGKAIFLDQYKVAA
jgi:hypothetical protein